LLAFVLNQEERMDAEQLKRCCTCKELMPASAFNKQRKSHDGLQSRCRKCCRAWYEAHRKRHTLNTGRRKAAALETIKLQVAEYLMEHPCVDCGEWDIRCLDFDHVDPTTKEFTISSKVLQAWSWERIEAELAKCVVRCANCHRRRTAECGLHFRHRWLVLQGRVQASLDVITACLLETYRRNPPLQIYYVPSQGCRP
jgi:hypothetical protein